MSNKNTPSTPKPPSGAQSPFLATAPTATTSTNNTNNPSSSSSSSSSSAHTSTGIPVSNVPLPTAQLFDIIPEVHELLARLLPSSPASGLTLHPTDPSSASASASTMGYPGYTDQSPLEIQQLATEASAIRIKMQKARQAVRELPDLDRTVAEQEVEMRELEASIRAQRKMLRNLVGKGGGQGGGEGEGEGEQNGVEES